MGKQGNCCQQFHIRRIWTNTHSFVCVCVHAQYTLRCKQAHTSLCIACKQNAIICIPIVIQNTFLPLFMKNFKGYINGCHFVFVNSAYEYASLSNLGNQHIPTNHTSLILKMTVGVPQVLSSLEDEALKIDYSKQNPTSLPTLATM